MTKRSFIIIATGDELVNGASLNTNSQYIAQELYKNFITVDLHITCKDNETHLKDIIAAYAKSHHIIITGGLGPTDDDITRDVVAAYLSKPLQYQSEVSSYVAQYIESKGLKMYERHHRQCYFPESSELLENKHGTAWGFIVQYEDSFIYVLPGPPKENQPMLNHCLKHMQSNDVKAIEHRLKWLVKGPEERIINIIDDVIIEHKLELHTCTHQNIGCDVYFSLPVNSFDSETATNIASEIENKWLAANISFSANHSLIKGSYE